MRVTFVLPFTSLEGGSRVVATYAEGLSRRGHDVTVVSCAKKRKRLKHRIKGWFNLAARGRLKPEHRPTHFDHIPHLHRRIPGAGPIRARHLPDADVVIATWWETAEWVSELPRSKGAKVHLIQHDERVFSDDPSKQARAAATWSFPGFSRIVVARWLADLGRREFGVESTLINNAVDMELFNGPPRRRNAIATFGLMYHARGFKGTDISLEAFRLAQKQEPSIRLKAFGPEPEMAHLPLPPGTPLEVLPPQLQIAAFYRSCDAYLFGSRSEGFGLPILEAMACRTPVIGTPTGAAPELIDEGGGFLVNMEDPRSMAEAIVEVARMPEAKWQQMSEAAFASARKSSWDRAIDAFEAAVGRAAAVSVQPGAPAHPEPKTQAAPEAVIAAST